MASRRAGSVPHGDVQRGAVEVVLAVVQLGERVEESLHLSGSTSRSASSDLAHVGDVARRISV